MGDHKLPAAALEPGDVILLAARAVVVLVVKRKYHAGHVDSTRITYRDGGRQQCATFGKSARVGVLALAPK